MTPGGECEHGALVSRDLDGRGGHATTPAGGEALEDSTTLGRPARKYG